MTLVLAPSNLAVLNEKLAVQHMATLVRAARGYLAAPIPQLRDQAARTVRVEARILRGLADQTGDATLRWAADEADLVIAKIVH